jgi:hypothetical protein
LVVAQNARELARPADHNDLSLLLLRESSHLVRQSRPSVLFVCVHNVGRSEMAAAYLSHLAGGRVEVRSAGSAPADAVIPLWLRP